jgi:hypothetical protein
MFDCNLSKSLERKNNDRATTTRRAVKAACGRHPVMAPASRVQGYLPSDAVRRMLMGLGMGATIIAIVLSPWGKQAGAHFNPALTLTFYRLDKVALWANALA